MGCRGLSAVGDGIYYTALPLLAADLTRDPVGTCYGDSGGPNFPRRRGDRDQHRRRTTITGDFMCRATNVDYRLDTVSARAFLGQYVTLP